MTLGPGEVFFQSTKLPPDPETGVERSVLNGDVLVRIFIFVSVGPCL
jgi:hypothetical protein